MLFGGKNQISDSLFSELDDNHKKTFREWISALIDRLKKLFSGNKTAEDEITKLEAKFKEMLKESLKSEVKGEGGVSLYFGNDTNINSNANGKFSQQFIDETVNSFGINIKKLSDYVYVQNKVFETLNNENFFEDKESSTRTDVNIEKGMIIETNKKGIKETFDFDNYSRLGKNKKIAKLATIRLIPEVIKYGHVVADNVPNKYNNRDTNKQYAYIEHRATVEGIDSIIKIAIKKTPQKNKFWVHSVYVIKNANDLLASTNYGTVSNYLTVDSKDNISQKVGTVNPSDEKTSKNSGASLSYTPETDTKYLDAVNRGDTETAQKMVDEAARAAGYDYHLYHGTNADFTKFDLLKHGGKNGKGEGYGIYLAANREISAPYGKNVIDSYVKFNRLAEGRKKTLSYAEVKKLVKQSCEVEAKRAVADGEADSISEAIRDTWVSNYVYTYDYSSMAKVYADVADMLWEGNDNDGELINEIMASSGAHYNYAGALDFYENILTPATGIDGFHYIWGNKDGSGVQNDVYLAFKSEQIKSADPITYDDNGDIIPLSQRFNEDESDIRFSYDEQERGRHLCHYNHKQKRQSPTNNCKNKFKS